MKSLWRVCFKKFRKFQPKLKQIVHLAGKIAAFLFLVFFVFSLIKNSTQLDKFISKPFNWFVILLSGFLYSCNLGVLGLAWAKILSSSRAQSLPVVAIFLTSQINKYIPGNIFHFVSRNVNARALGFDLKKIIFSISLEIISMILASSIIAVYFLLNINNDYKDFIYNILAFSLGVLLISPYILSKFNIRLPLLKALAAFPMYLCFFILTGLIIYWAGIQTELISKQTSLVLFVSFISLTWIMGFITPGASGGVGVREGVMILLGTNAFLGSDVVTLGLLFRLITVFGDLFARFLGSFFVNYTHKIEGKESPSLGTNS